MISKKVSLESVKKLIAGLSEDDKKTIASSRPDDPPWLKYVAMLTGVLAGLAGFLVVCSTTLTNQAIYESNQAILAQAQSSDAWAEYQADSIKARIVETQLLPSMHLSASDHAALLKEDNDLRNRQPQNKQLAEDKGIERELHMKGSAGNLVEKDLLQDAGLAMQIGIALASVAAMVRNRTVFYGAVGAGVMGILLMAYAYLTHLLAS